MEHLSEDALSDSVPIVYWSVVDLPHGLSERHQLFVQLIEVLLLLGTYATL